MSPPNPALTRQSAKFYNNSKELKGQVVRLQRIEPNKDIINTVGCEVWGGVSKITNFQAGLIPPLLLGSIDFGCGILTGVLLWVFCRPGVVLKTCL